MKFRIGDIVKIKEDNKYSIWYTSKELKILGYRRDIYESEYECYIYKVDYEWPRDAKAGYHDVDNEIHEDYIYLFKSVREIKLDKLNEIP